VVLPSKGCCARTELYTAWADERGGDCVEDDVVLLLTANQEGDPAMLQCRVLGDGVWCCSGDAMEEGCHEEEPWSAVCCAQGDVGGWMKEEMGR